MEPCSFFLSLSSMMKMRSIHKWKGQTSKPNFISPLSSKVGRLLVNKLVCAWSSYIQWYDPKWTKTGHSCNHIFYESPWFPANEIIPRERVKFTHLSRVPGNSWNILKLSRTFSLSFSLCLFLKKTYLLIIRSTMTPFRVEKIGWW